MSNIPRGLAAIKKLYGNPDSPQFKNNIVLLVSPKFMACGPFKIWCHKLATADIRAALDELAAMEKKLGKALVRSFDGCWVKRNKRWTKGKMSTHSWGIALDFNTASGGLSLVTAGPFIRRGWTWGGNWTRKDTMHVQRAAGY